MTENASRNGIPTRVLGRTGTRVTVLGIGGYHLGDADSSETAVRIVRTAIDEGINFIDNAWCYHGGRSEELAGQALRNGYRDRVLLMTKNHGRDAGAFERQLDDSLRRLRTDHIDLLQLHEIVHEGEPERIACEGVLEALERAREAGKIRFVGFTGHRWPRLLGQMLELEMSWDTLQFPTNILDATYRSFVKEVLPRARKHGLGIIGMKSLAGGHILQAGVSVDEALAYALSLPVDTVVSGIDSIEVLEQNLSIVRAWNPLTEDEMQGLERRLAEVANDGHLEFYKTSW